MHSLLHHPQERPKEMTTLTRREQFAMAAMPLAHSHYPHETDKQVAYCLRLANELEAALNSGQKKGDASLSDSVHRREMIQVSEKLHAEQQAHAETAEKLRQAQDIQIKELLAHSTTTVKLSEAEAKIKLAAELLARNSVDEPCDHPSECNLASCLANRALKILQSP